MKFWHGTSEETWAKVQAEGVLWGVRNAPSRCTYLATDRDEASSYGPVVLEVEYDPQAFGAKNNYGPDVWQVRVYDPIPLANIRRVRVLPIWVRWLRRAWDKLRDGWYLALLFIFTCFEFGAAIIEFVLHVLRIPHWH